METGFWSGVSRSSAALSYTPMVSAAPGPRTESNPCVVSFFPAKYTLQPYFPFENTVSQGLHHLRLCRCHCSVRHEWTAALERRCFLTTFNTQICLTERSFCSIKVHVCSFTISINPIKLTNAKVIKNQDVLYSELYLEVLRTEFCLLQLELFQL